MNAHENLYPPLENTEQKYFDKYIQEVLSKIHQRFCEKSNSIEEKEKQIGLIESINASIKYHYAGRPHEAYRVLTQQLKEILKNKNQEDNAFLFKLFPLNLDGPVDPQKILERLFFRLRVDQDVCGQLTQDGLKHIPFHQRTLVKPFRYSISGYPCTYVAENVYLAWEELGRPNIEYLHGMSFYLKDDQSLTLLDLSSIDEQTWWFPLIAACSVHVNPPLRSHPFIPEYTIPQLLLQYVREDDSIDGIRYRSTRIKDASYRLENTGRCNVVLATSYEDSNNTHCRSLDKFEMSPVESYAYEKQKRITKIDAGTFGAGFTDETVTSEIKKYLGSFNIGFGDRVLEYIDSSQLFSIFQEPFTKEKLSHYQLALEKETNDLF
jgi:hypothetical protein